MALAVTAASSARSPGIAQRRATIIRHHNASRDMRTGCSRTSPGVVPLTVQHARSFSGPSVLGDMRAQVRRHRSPTLLSC